MGLNIHITTVRDGTIKSTVQYVAGERANGTLRLSFGRTNPQALIHFIDGDPVAATFGRLRGEVVFDLILCQELAITEIEFAPSTVSSWRDGCDRSVLLDTENLNQVLKNQSKAVAGCAARPYIYGPLPVQTAEGEPVGTVLKVIHDFDKYQALLESVDESESDRMAPLMQCALIRRALDRQVMAYKTPLVAMRFLKSLLNFVQPLEGDEAENLKGYMRALLPHPRATHVPLERFYAFASAVEAIAYRRGQESGDEAKKFIYKCIRDAAHEGIAPVAASSEAVNYSGLME